MISERNMIKGLDRSGLPWEYSFRDSSYHVSGGWRRGGLSLSLDGDTWMYRTRMSGGPVDSVAHLWRLLNRTVEQAGVASRVATFYMASLQAGPYLYPEAGSGASSGVLRDLEELRKLPVEERGQSPAWVHLLGPEGTPPYKMTKLEVAYTDESPYQQNCANCIRSYTHNTTGVSICDWMRGVVDPKGWCRVWKEPMPREEYEAYQERGQVLPGVKR